MDDRYYIYQVSPKGLHKMDYCNGVEGFIKFVLNKNAQLLVYQKLKSLRFLNGYISNISR